MKSWLVVREVSSANSVARHWVQAKHRYCVLENCVLALRTSDTTTSTVGEYSLSMATVKVHHYSKERHTLVVNCHPVHSTDISTEVTLQLQDKEQALLWLKELEKEIATASEEQQKHTDRALGALNGFLKERLFLRSRQVGDAELLERQLQDMSNSTLHNVSHGEKKINFDADLNMDNKVWKADDYNVRYAAEVDEKYGTSEDEKESEWARNKSIDSSVAPSHSVGQGAASSHKQDRNQKPKKESELSVDFEDDYDFVNIQDEDSVPEGSRSSSLTSYFGSVASALYSNAETSLAMSLTGSGSRLSARAMREKESRSKTARRNGHQRKSSDSNKATLSSSSPSVLHQGQIQSNSNSSSSSTTSSSSSGFAPPFAGHSSVALKHLYNFPIPKLRILIMAVGTRGDVQPLALLGMQLIADGHRVRLATHRCYREYVMSFGGGGLEFYPLGGDPVKLSEFMVKTHGYILPSSPDVLKLVPENLAMLNDIINSCWGACVDVDPGPGDGKSDGTGSGRKFQADAIISNPVTYAHIHCAEALGVPLHLFFPQPWVPTKAFPHPLACMSYGKDNQWSTENYLSYQLVERMMWMSLEPFINSFRTQKLNLPPIRRGEHGWNLLNTHKVPFVKMWSKYLVPVPKDWGPHVEVVGFFLDKRKKDSGKVKRSLSSGDSNLQSSTHSISTASGGSIAAGDQGGPIEKKTETPLISVDTGTYQPTDSLREFLERGPPPVFVGFGSMVVEDAASLIQILLDGAALLGVRILLQSGWSEISEESFLRMTASAAMKAQSKRKSGSNDCNMGEYDALLIGALPHDWLFPYLRAVIHHGGAGTTAAGLCAGKPTMVCPFFGDQHFWGHMVFQAGVGPEPCSIHELTPEKVASGLKVLLSKETGRNAKKLAIQMNTENGVNTSLDSFYSHIHLEDMICDVSIFHGESRVAQVWCRQCRFKMNKEVCDIIHDSSNPNNIKVLGANDNYAHDIEPCVFVNWAERRQPVSTTDGLMQGVGGVTHEVVGGISDALLEPLSALYHGEGVRGAMDGMVHGLQGLIIRPITGGFVLYNKVSKGIKESMNSRRSGIESKRQALPDQQRHFSRPGGISRQEDSVYGAAAMSRMMSEEVESTAPTAVATVDSPMPDLSKQSALLQTNELVENFVTVFDESLESEEDEVDEVRQSQTGVDNQGDERPSSIESDVLALDQTMQRVLRQSDGAAFISDAVPDSVKVSGLFHSFSTEDGPFAFDIDSGVDSGVGSPALSSSEILEGSALRGGPLGLWRESPAVGTPPRLRRPCVGSPSVAKKSPADSVEESEVKMIFSPMADYLSEEDLTGSLDLLADTEDQPVTCGSALKISDEDPVSSIAAEVSSLVPPTDREDEGDEESQDYMPKTVDTRESDMKGNISERSDSKDSEENNVKPPALLFNSMLLTEQLQNMNQLSKTVKKDDNCKDDQQASPVPSAAEAKHLREVEILKGYLLAKKIQQTLEDVIGSTSRFITFEDFAVLLAQAMGKNWLCPQEELQAVTRKLAQTISERKEFLDFVDFSLLFLSMQDEIKWKDMPDRIVGKK